jgi:hypothetical protein
VSRAAILLVMLMAEFSALAAEKPSPKVGDDHDVPRVNMGLNLPQALTGVSPTPGAKEAEDLIW